MISASSNTGAHGASLQANRFNVDIVPPGIEASDRRTPLRARVTFLAMVSPGSPDLSDLLSPLPVDEAETVPATEAADTAAIVADIAAAVRDRHQAVVRGEKKPSP